MPSLFHVAVGAAVAALVWKKVNPQRPAVVGLDFGLGGFGGAAAEGGAWYTVAGNARQGYRTVTFARITDAAEWAAREVRARGDHVRQIGINAGSGGVVDGLVTIYANRGGPFGAAFSTRFTFRQGAPSGPDRG